MYLVILNFVVTVFHGSAGAATSSVAELADREFRAITEVQEAASRPTDDSWEQRWSYQGSETRLVAFTPEKGAVQITEVRWKDKLLLKEHRSLIGSKLRKTFVSDRHLFLFWGKGVHGETVAVIDMALGKVVLRKNFPWPVSLAEKDGGIGLTINRSPEEGRGEQFQRAVEWLSTSGGAK